MTFKDHIPIRVVDTRDTRPLFFYRGRARARLINGYHLGRVTAWGAAVQRLKAEVNISGVNLLAKS